MTLVIGVFVSLGFGILAIILNYSFAEDRFTWMSTGMDAMWFGVGFYGVVLGAAFTAFFLYLIWREMRKSILSESRKNKSSSRALKTSKSSNR